jgi:hypothetical protein
MKTIANFNPAHGLIDELAVHFDRFDRAGNPSATHVEFETISNRSHPTLDVADKYDAIIPIAKPKGGLELKRLISHSY